MMTALNFMTAIFWGQLSKCEVVSTSIAHYTCIHRTAYGAVATFSVLLFLVQLAFTTGVVIWRGEIINETGLYDDISSASPNLASSTGHTYDASSHGGKFLPPQSADL